MEFSSDTKPNAEQYFSSFMSHLVQFFSIEWGFNFIIFKALRLQRFHFYLEWKSRTIHLIFNRFGHSVIVSRDWTRRGGVFDHCCYCSSSKNIVYSLLLNDSLQINANIVTKGPSHWCTSATFNKLFGTQKGKTSSRWLLLQLISNWALRLLSTIRVFRTAKRSILLVDEDKSKAFYMDRSTFM